VRPLGTRRRGMGKNDFLSPKGIANASKAKGLQKLRFYCQVCAKQCRDQNGFKCHITSEAHLRQMALFGQNQSRFIDGYSEEFLKEFLSLMAVSHRNSRVAANVVYNEFIANKEHTHMNSTKWTSLTEFIKYLGREGIASIDETPKGWFLTYVPEDREEKMRQESQKRKRRATEDASVRDARLIEEQIARAFEGAREEDASWKKEATALRRDGDARTTGFALGAGDHFVKRNKKMVAPRFSAFGDEDDETGDAALATVSLAAKKPRSAMEEIMIRGLERERAETKDRIANSATPRLEMTSVTRETTTQGFSASAGVVSDTPWLMKNIVVKITSEALRDSGFYRKKGVVKNTRDGGFVGEIVPLDHPETALRVDQAELETVLPAVGGAVVIVRGPTRGRKGTLKKLETEHFRAVVDADGTEERYEYEDVCKLVK